MEIRSEEDTTIKFKLDKNILTVSSDPMHHGFWGPQPRPRCSTYGVPW